MDCPELLEILKGLQGKVIPLDLGEPLELHLSQCQACRSGMNNFLKINQILSKTVYSAPNQDNNLAYLSQVAGRKLRWQTLEEQKAAHQHHENRLRLLLRIFIWVLVAAGVGASSALILGRHGFIGSRKPALQAEPDSGKPVTPLSAAAPTAHPVEPPDKPAPAPVPASAEIAAPTDSAVNPETIYEYLNSQPEPSSTPIRTLSAGVADSTHLKDLDAELGALRDAVSRTPRDRELRDRALGKYREVIDERKKIGRSSGVKDYYSLGYLHYLNGEYPQTAIVTSEGLLRVHIGPTQYLHYLKAMSHYQMAQKASTPLPPDKSSAEKARVRGETLRAELDMEGRKKAILEYRKAIADFSYLLNNPELESTAKEWILKCNEQIGKSAAVP